jgi:hypothetical protein
MDNREIDRIWHAIRRSFGSSPHKKKYWLALLEMHVAQEKAGNSEGRKAGRGSAVRNPSIDSGKR